MAAPAMPKVMGVRAWFTPGLILALLAAPLSAQDLTDPAATRADLAAARAQGLAAAQRAERLEAQAADATASADRTAAQAAAVAARIQQAEAAIAADQAQIALIDRQRAALRAEIARRQRPLMRLTGALQLMSRRPLAVALLRPGSIEDAVHLRALLETLLPEVSARTAALRTQIAQGRALQAQAQAAAHALRSEKGNLATKRATLTALETRQRLAARSVESSADREAERALALSEQARDLGSLVTTLDKAGAMAAELARLPGPVLRPDNPGAGPAPADTPAPTPQGTAAPSGYMLPVAGRLVSGFAGSGGIAIATRADAQVVAPGAGRVAFAGPFRGYGQIVILTHDGDWTSLVTGLVRVDVAVGDVLVAGAPLGVMGPERPQLGLELRHGGAAVNPLEAVGK